MISNVIAQNHNTIQQVNIRELSMAFMAKKGLTEEGEESALERQSSVTAKNSGSGIRQPGFRSQLCHWGYVILVIWPVSQGETVPTL